MPWNSVWICWKAWAKTYGQNTFLQFGKSIINIESKADWADEISRDGTQGSWAPCNAFSVKGCRVVVKLLKHPSLAVFLIFKHSQEL